MDSPGEDAGHIPPEPTHSCVRAASGGQGRPGSAARVAGCLDRRLIRRATLTCLRLRGRVSMFTGLPVHHLCSPVASSMTPEFFAPDLSEGARRGGYRDACSIARSPCEDYWTRVRYPVRGHPIPRWGVRPSGVAGRPPAASRAPRSPRPRRADRCPKQTEGLTECRKAESGSPKGQRRSRRFAISHSMAIAVWAKWRRVVGRHARQIRGELVRCDKYLSLPLGYKSGVPLLYPSIGIRERTIGRLAVR
jgi:hypothetical protein